MCCQEAKQSRARAPAESPAEIPADIQPLLSGQVIRTLIPVPAVK